MQRHSGLYGIDLSGALYGGQRSRSRRRKTLTLKQKLWIWDNARSQGLSKLCHICHKRITRFADMELDHIRAASKGGKKLAFAHKDCNRIKSSGSLREIQNKLGIKSRQPKRKVTRRRSRRTTKVDIFGNIIRKGSIRDNL